MVKPISLPRTLDQLVDRATITLPKLITTIGEFENIMSILSSKSTYTIKIDCSRELESNRKKKKGNVFDRPEDYILKMEARIMTSNDSTTLTYNGYIPGTYFSKLVRGKTKEVKADPSFAFETYDDVYDEDDKKRKVADIIRYHSKYISIWDKTREVVAEYFSS